MANINLGPAVTSTPSTLNVLTPVNALGPTVPGQGGNALRLIAVGRSVPVGGTGDVAFLPVINATTWVPATVAICNAQGGSAAAVNLTINSGAAVTGTSIRGAGALTTLTGPTVALVAAAATLTAVVPAQGVFVNVSAASAGITLDIFVYGYDVS